MQDQNGKSKAFRHNTAAQLEHIEATGLPVSSYSEAEVGMKSESVFRHVYWACPMLPSPYYGAQA